RIFETEPRPELGAGDVVLLLFFQNDFFDNVDPDRIHGELRDGQVVTLPPRDWTAAPLTQWLKEHLYTINAIAYAADSWSLGRRQRQQLDGAPAAVAIGSDLTRITAHYLAAFRDAVRASRARFLVAYVPGQRELGEGAGAVPAPGEEVGLLDSPTYPRT